MAKSGFAAWVRLLVFSLLSVALTMGGCSSSDSQSASDPYYDEFGVTPFDSEGPIGKADNSGIPSIGVEYDNTATQVWAVKNAWEDRTTPEARKAGITWPADSGLNWDEKYALWVQSMKKIPADSSWGGDTFELTTPWGKTLPAPKLECAELAMFLRVSFASWFGLPFYMTTVDSAGTRVYFGHFGARTATGNYKKMPAYKTAYRDYSSTPAAEWQASWPKDTSLRSKGLYGGGDEMDFIFAGAKAGGYFDEIYLNKRVGHFALHLLSYFGSVNLANSRNTYNLKPDAVRAGDALVKRWQKQGIGHVYAVKSVTALEDGRIDAQLASGSMPRRQPKWEDAVASKYAFTDATTGGEGTASDGEPYAKLGGGLKRFRVAKNWNGKWTNSWMKADEASWINDTDYERIAARPKEFENLLGQVPPEQLRDALLGIIADARTHLQNYPASCSARTKREHAWRDLYRLLEEKLGVSRAQADAQYRVLDDYVFAELVYDQSKTCCWNSTTSAMYQIAIAYNQSLQQSACVAPVVFKNTNGGYQLFEDFAASTGKASDWKDWSEDEPCAQRDVPNDTEATHEWLAYCSLPSGSGGSGGSGGTGGTGGTGGNGGTGGTGGTGGAGGTQPSCQGHCGSSEPVPGSNPSCYCDSACTQNSDCCPDYTTLCP